MASSPLASHFKLSVTMTLNSEEEVEYMAQVPYANAVGKLMYAMVCTRPDIAQAVSMISRFMANLSKQRWLAVKWILRYLRGTKIEGLMYQKIEQSHMVRYVDSDYTDDLNKWRSSTGYVFTLGRGPIS